MNECGLKCTTTQLSIKHPPTHSRPQPPLPAPPTFNPNTRLTWCYVCPHSASGLHPDAFLKSNHINSVDTYIYILYIYISMSELIEKSNGMTLVIYIYILYIFHGIQQVVHQVT